MFMVLIDWKEKDYGFHTITHNELISIEKIPMYSQNFEHFISNETDEEKLIEKIEKILNEKG